MENLLFYGGIGAMAAAAIVAVVAVLIFRGKTMRLDRTLDGIYGKPIQKENVN